MSFLKSFVVLAALVASSGCASSNNLAGAGVLVVETAPRHPEGARLESVSCPLCHSLR